MTALLLEILASWARLGSGLLTAYLVAHGILTPDQGDRFIVEAVKLTAVYGPAIMGMAWGAWASFKKRQKMLTGLEMSRGSSEAAVEQHIANGMGAKVI